MGRLLHALASASLPAASIPTGSTSWRNTPVAALVPAIVAVILDAALCLAVAVYITSRNGSADSQPLASPAARKAASAGAALRPPQAAAGAAFRSPASFSDRPTFLALPSAFRRGSAEPGQAASSTSGAGGKLADAHANRTHHGARTFRKALRAQAVERSASAPEVPVLGLLRSGPPLCGKPPLPRQPFAHIDGKALSIAAHGGKCTRTESTALPVSQSTLSALPPHVLY